MEAQQQLSIKANEIKALKKENRKRRQFIETYQDMMNSGATGLHTVKYCCVNVFPQQYFTECYGQFMILTQYLALC